MSTSKPKTSKQDLPALPWHLVRVRVRARVRVSVGSSERIASTWGG